MLDTLLPVQELIRETIQGEGFWTGQLSSFIRLCGCPVACHFCDTGYATPESIKQIKSSTLSVQDIVSLILCDHVVITGGEPMMHQRHLQDLLSVLRQNHCFITVETSGSFPLITGFNWITLSPKEHLNSRFKVYEDYWEQANELKFVVNQQSDIDYYLPYIELFLSQEKPVFLQPQWYDKQRTLDIILEFLKSHPKARLSVQVHKYLGLK